MTDGILLSCHLSHWTGDLMMCRWCDFGLRGRQRRWCSPECAELAWTNHAWWKARPAALERDGFKCVRCGAPKIHRRLHVHHDPPLGSVKRSEVGCHHHLDRLTTLCGGRKDSCHGTAHYGGLLEVAA